MRKALLTFGWGAQFEDIHKITRPRMQKYAEAHGYDLISPACPPRGDWPSEYVRSPSWFKVPLMQWLLEGDGFVDGRVRQYELVLWLDADILVSRFDQDIADELEDGFPMALAMHDADPYDRCINCGVWLVAPEAAPILNDIRAMNPKEHPLTWRTWEQGALLLLMGADSAPGSKIGFPIVLPERYNFDWTELGQEWNASSADNRGIPKDSRFLHASNYVVSPGGDKTYPTKLETLMRWVEEGR